MARVNLFINLNKSLPAPEAGSTYVRSHRAYFHITQSGHSAFLPQPFYNNTGFSTTFKATDVYQRLHIKPVSNYTKLLIFFLKAFPKYSVGGWTLQLNSTYRGLARKEQPEHYLETLVSSSKLFSSLALVKYSSNDAPTQETLWIFWARKPKSRTITTFVNNSCLAASMGNTEMLFRLAWNSASIHMQRWQKTFHHMAGIFKLWWLCNEFHLSCSWMYMNTSPEMADTAQKCSEPYRACTAWKNVQDQLKYVSGNL